MAGNGINVYISGNSFYPTQSGNASTDAVGQPVSNTSGGQQAWGSQDVYNGPNPTGVPVSLGPLPYAQAPAPAQPAPSATPAQQPAGGDGVTDPTAFIQAHPWWSQSPLNIDPATQASWAQLQIDPTNSGERYAALNKEAGLEANVNSMPLSSAQKSQMINNLRTEPTYAAYKAYQDSLTGSGAPGATNTTALTADQQTFLANHQTAWDAAGMSPADEQTCAQYGIDPTDPTESSQFFKGENDIRTSGLPQSTKDELIQNFENQPTYALYKKYEPASQTQQNNQTLLNTNPNKPLWDKIMSDNPGKFTQQDELAWATLGINPADLNELHSYCDPIQQQIDAAIASGDTATAQRLGSDLKYQAYQRFLQTGISSNDIQVSKDHLSQDQAGQLIGHGFANGWSIGDIVGGTVGGAADFLGGVKDAVGDFFSKL